METIPMKKQRAITSDRVSAEKPANVVINRFGGLTKFCNATGFSTSTVHGWMVSGYIPPHRKGESTYAYILQVAADNDIALDPADFVEMPDAPTANG